MRKISNNPFLFFSPFLVLYILIVLLGHKDLMEGDEGRYYAYAQNLLHGFYSPSNEVYLWNGPGYPLVLAVLIGTGLPLMACTMVNAVFQYLSVVFLFKTLRLFTSKPTVLFFSILWGCFYIGWKEMTLLYTEPLSNMLICMFIYCSCSAFLHKGKQWKYVVIAGLLLAFLTLTKIIFGYIILVLLLALIALYLVRRLPVMQKALLIAAIALLGNLPYLFYTWQLTGKPLYWGNSGGMSLYWASTPVEAEFGDWNDDHFTAYCGYDDNMECNAALFAMNHQADYDSIYRFTGVARDEAFQRKGIQNIKKYPTKYLKNCIANAGRFFLGIPYSYNYQRLQNAARIPAGAAVILLLAFTISVSLFNLRRIPFSTWFFAAIFFLYLGASLVVSTNQRQLALSVPLLLVWAAWLFERTVSFRIRLPEVTE